MYKNNQKYCKKSYFGVDVQGVTGSSPVSSTIKTAVFVMKRRFFLTFWSILRWSLSACVRLDHSSSHRQRKNCSPGSLVPEDSSLCLILPLFWYADQSFPQRIKRSPAFLFTTSFQSLFFTSEFAVIPKVDIFTPRVTETVSVNILVFTGFVVETPF